MEEENHLPNNLLRGYISSLEGTNPMSCWGVSDTPFFLLISKDPIRYHESTGDPHGRQWDFMVEKNPSKSR